MRSVARASLQANGGSDISARTAVTFQFRFAATGRKELAAWELAVLLEAIHLSKGKRLERFALPGDRKFREARKKSRDELFFCCP